MPWYDSYCRLTAEDGRHCEITHALQDARLTEHAAREAVQAYVAVLLKTPDGAPLGTLCHYDLHQVTPPLGVFEDLDAVCPAVERALLKLALLPAATPIFVPSYLLLQWVSAGPWASRNSFDLPLDAGGSTPNNHSAQRAGKGLGRAVLRETHRD